MDKKPRLIDADALKEYIGCADAVKYGNKNAEQQHNSYSTMMMYEIADYIDDMPTIEAEPVRHGRWEHCVGKSNLWYCSECGGKILYNPTRRTYNITKLPVEEMNRVCRKCGAKMDGGKENDRE